MPIFQLDVTCQNIKYSTVRCCFRPHCFAVLSDSPFYSIFLITSQDQTVCLTGHVIGFVFLTGKIESAAFSVAWFWRKQEIRPVHSISWKVSLWPTKMLLCFGHETYWRGYMNHPSIFQLWENRYYRTGVGLHCKPWVSSGSIAQHMTMHTVTGTGNWTVWVVPRIWSTASPVALRFSVSLTHTTLAIFLYFSCPGVVPLRC